MEEETKEDQNPDLEMEEGMAMLLGGISISIMKNTSWNSIDENDDGQEQNETQGDGSIDLNEYNAASHEADYSNLPEAVTKEINDEINEEIDQPIHSNFSSMNEQATIFERSFCLHPTRGTIQRPPVKIVNMSHKNNRGFCLKAIHPIKRGQVIFSEKAVESAQIIDNGNSIDDRTQNTVNHKSLPKQRQLYKVRGCQHCFRSMEPASCFMREKSSDRDNDVCEALPLSHLWPVPEYDNLGLQSIRSICSECGATFCSKSCHDMHEKLMGSCCICTNAIWDVCISVCNKENNNSEYGLQTHVNPAYIIAARMLCSSLQRYRQRGQESQNSNDAAESTLSSSLESMKHEQENVDFKYPFFSMCGDPSDISKLELGIIDHDENDSKEFSSSRRPSYTLRHIHSSLTKTLSLSEDELKYFNLQYFHKLVSTIARNAIGVTTQSPFKEYYAGLLRSCSGGRGSEQHKQHMERVAVALGAQDGKITRQMDRDIEDKCAIKTISLFTLTCRMNHSCDPSAQVQSQVFVDNHIDIVALRDIDAEEEITISYINLGKNAGRVATDRVKRMKELESRYLFLCDCVRCTNSSV